ncbi:MAG: HEAT repeat domain-containing protein [Planctomycetota bacterium]
MERVTFPDKKVRAALASYVVVKINVDRESNRKICRRYRPAGRIPSYAIVDPKGKLVGQFVGFPQPDPFRKALANPERPAPKRTPSPGPELDRRIKAAIRRFDEPAPGGVGARITKWLGGEPKTMIGWVEGQNDALDELTQIGSLAVPALLRSMEHGSARCVDRCSTVLGRIKAPEAKRTIQVLLQHERAHVRAAAAQAMGLYCDRAFLPALCERLRDTEELVNVRYEAAHAIRGIAASYGGIDDPAVARALLLATRTDHAPLRWICLQALLSFDSPFDLATLFPLMDDRRPGFGGKSDHSVAANACWVFMRLSGQRIERIDGEEFGDFSPKEIAFLKAWYAREKSNLTWDRQRKHFRLRDS